MNHFLAIWLGIGTLFSAVEAWNAERGCREPSFSRTLFVMVAVSLNTIAVFRLWGAP